MAYQKVWENLAVVVTGGSGTKLFEDSQPIRMVGTNAVNFDVTVLSADVNSPGSVQVYLMMSNQQDNWTAQGSAVNATVVGATAMNVGTVGMQFARLRLEATSGGAAAGATVVLSAGMNQYPA